MKPERAQTVEVLVVDDNPANLIAIEAALGELNARVVRAQSGGEALRLLLDRDFALILLDVKMPTLDGFETARLIRARKRSCVTPIVFITAYSSDDADVLAAYELGAVDFLFKPIRPELLCAKVAVFVDLQARSAEAEQQAVQIREHERREHERSLQAEREHWKAEALRQQMEELSRIDRHKDRFLAVLGHELRNPLSSIVAGLEILREKLEPEEVHVDATMLRTRDILDRQVKLLARLVDDLLDIARISSGQIQLRREDILLSDLIEQAVNTSQPSIQERNQLLSVLVPEEPITLSGDTIRLVQVVANLLSNASRYTPMRGLIAVNCASRNDGIEIQVSDNGRGIAKDFVPHVFEAFSQESQQSGAGLGVGLSVVRQLVALHKGTVAVHSQGPGMGSEFVVWLPITATERPPPEPAQESLPVGTWPSTRALSIVLIDDSEDVRELMTELLRGWGHHVKVAPDGESGSELALREKPDVTFVDIGLPKLDGYGVATLLKSRPDFSSRLVAMTGFGQESDKRRALDAGFDVHLVKPASIEALRAALTFEERHGRRP
jgi:signal transduction histidine kinase